MVSQTEPSAIVRRPAHQSELLSRESVHAEQTGNSSGRRTGAGARLSVGGNATQSLGNALATAARHARTGCWHADRLCRG